jgi:hypothetical protein
MALAMGRRGRAPPSRTSRPDPSLPRSDERGSLPLPQGERGFTQGVTVTVRSVVVVP